MIITCPHCGKRHKLPEEWSANKVRCSRCKEKFFLDELASEFIAPDAPPHVADDVRAESARRHTEGGATQNPPLAKTRLVTSSATVLRLAVGIAAVLIIAGTAAFYFFRVAPENKFRQAMREGQQAENRHRWDDALNAYLRAERLKPHDVNATDAWQRVLEKRRLAEYAEAMARGKVAEQSNNWETALREYENALMRKSNDAEAKDSIARAQYQLHMKEGREAERQQRWDMALIAYSHALAVKRGDEDATTAMSRCEYLAALERGQKAEGLQKWGEAMMAYQKALRLQPNDPTATESLERVGLKIVEEFKPQEMKLDAERLAAAQNPTSSYELPALKVVLQWSVTEFASKPAVAPGGDSATPERLKPWIVQRLLEGAGEQRVSVQEIPKGDETAWWCARQYDTASGDAKILNGQIAEHLLMADYLLNEKAESDKRRGLGLVLQASRCALIRLKDKELALAITDAYLLPSLQVADEKPTGWLSKRNVIEHAIRVYGETGQTDKLIAAYKMFIAAAPSKNAADFARIQLAQIHAKNGRFEEAKQFLSEMEEEKTKAVGQKMMKSLEVKLNKGPQK
jgi:pentatricopeptide repeat protein